jgi:glycosyltransferase involved in cell wall biosynthesis
MAYLWLTRYPPYAPLKGGALDYTRDLVHSLARQAPVDALAYRAPGVLPPPHGDARWTMLPIAAKPRVASVISPLPNVASRNVDAGYLTRATEMAAAAEAVFVDFIAMAWIVEPLTKALAALPGRPPVIMITHNYEAAVRRQMAAGTRSPLMRAALRFDGWKAERLERAANAAADGLTAITSTDREAFARECDTPSITLPPAYDGPIAPDRRITADTPRTMTILGNRSSHHKLMVLERTLAALSAIGLQKTANVDIAGDGDFSGFAERYPGFHYRGYVEDLSAYLADVRLGLVSDDIGGGFKIRAMTYAFLGVPMLALRDAMLGMDFEDGRHFIGVDTLDDLARTAATLIDDTDRLESLRREAYAFAADRFDTSAAGRRLVDFASGLRHASAEPVRQAVVV